MKAIKAKALPILGKESRMKTQKKKQYEPPRPEPSVVIRATVMTEQQAHRLSTAVDALLAEWVRREMSRERQS
jgi:hypothetical protein